MATSFPSGLDSLTNPSSGDSLSSPSHSAQHANVNDAVEALQAKVGVDGSAVATSLDYQLANIGTWTSYTPTLTASVTNPTLGTGSTQYGLYTQIGDLVIGTAYIAFGSSGTAGGSGTYRVSAPVPIDTNDVKIIAGQAALYDSSGAYFLQHAVTSSTSTTFAFYSTTGGSPATATSGTPFGWTNFDQIRVQFIYKAA